MSSGHFKWKPVLTWNSNVQANVLVKTLYSDVCSPPASSAASGWRPAVCVGGGLGGLLCWMAVPLPPHCASGRRGEGRGCESGVGHPLSRLSFQVDPTPGWGLPSPHTSLTSWRCPSAGWSLRLCPLEFTSSFLLLGPCPSRRPWWSAP